MKIIRSIFLLLMTLPLAASNQRRTEPCGEMVYENRNQVDYGPLQLGTVQGVVQDQQGIRIPKACLGIFAEGDHKRIATAETNDDGRFALEKIPKGLYRIVVKYEGFCLANARVQISGKRGTTAVVHMQAGGIDTCSFIETK